MRSILPTSTHLVALVAVAVSTSALLDGQRPGFHGAPPSAKSMVNPDDGDPSAVIAGKPLYHLRCARCHGEQGAGSGNIPAFGHGKINSATSGERFWFITKGAKPNGMPSWSSLPKEQRWKIITYVKALGSGQVIAASARKPESAPVGTSKSTAPIPNAPFTDYRFEKPGTVRKITVKDLPAPFATKSAGNGPKLVLRPDNAWPQVKPWFKVQQYAAGLDRPPLIRTAPNGDFFVAESQAGDIRAFRGITSTGKAEEMQVFASDLNRPFGINFYPPGPDPQWIYVGNTDSIVRFPYQKGDMKARGKAEHLADVPAGDGHWTRDIQFSPDGKKMFVSVGSASNVDDPDTTPSERNRADILEFNPDGSGMRVYAYGIRNAVGLAINSETGELWCSVNERDALGDNLVPDYITHVQYGGFYGWPWWYIGAQQDSRHAGKRPDLKSKVIVPDVLLHPHNASLEMTFYDGKQFPAEYRDDIFASEHGSWNKATRVGYEVIRVPLHQTGYASGEYEDFMTGFIVDDGHVWGRPVGITVSPDSSLLVTDDGSNSIWRISYAGK